MSFLSGTKVTKRRAGCGNLTRKARKRYIIGQKNLCCEKCKVELSESSATLDHVIPNIIIMASKGRLKQSINNFRVLCRICNNRDNVPNWLGILFKSHDINAIQMASRNLCNLVRS